MGKQPYVELRAEHVVRHVVGVYFKLFFLVRITDKMLQSVPVCWCEGSVFCSVYGSIYIYSFDAFKSVPDSERVSLVSVIYFLSLMSL